MSAQNTIRLAAFTLVVVTGIFAIGGCKDSRRVNIQDRGGAAIMNPTEQVTAEPTPPMPQSSKKPLTPEERKQREGANH